MFAAALLAVVAATELAVGEPTFGTTAHVYGAAVDSNSKGLLLVTGGDGGYVARPFDADLNPSGPPLRFLDGPGSDPFDVATNGLDHLLAVGGAELTLGILKEDGRVFRPASIEVAPRILAVEWTGSRYAVVWTGQPGRNPDVAGALLDIDGRVVAGPVVLWPAKNGVSFLDMAATSNGDLLVTWGDNSDQGVFSGHLTAADIISGAPAPPRRLPGVGRPTVSSNGNGFLVLWTDDIAYAIRQKGVRLLSDGTPLDTTPLDLGSSRTQSAPGRAGWNGNDYVVLWNAPEGFLVSALVSPAGNVTAIPAPDVTTGEVLATTAGANGAVLFWKGSNGVENPQLYGDRFTLGGAHRARSGLLFSGGPQAQELLATAACAERTFILWNDSGAKQRLNLSVIRGGYLESRVQLGRPGDFDRNAAIHCGGSGALAVWNDAVTGKASGVTLENGPALRIGSPFVIGALRPEDVVWTGSEWIVVSADGGTLAGTRLARDGAPLGTKTLLPGTHPAVLWRGTDLVIAFGTEIWRFTPALDAIGKVADLPFTVESIAGGAGGFAVLGGTRVARFSADLQPLDGESGRIIALSPSPTGIARDSSAYTVWNDQVAGNLAPNGAVALTTTVGTNEIIEDVIETGGVRQLVITRSDSLAAPRLFVRVPAPVRHRGVAH
jgi:hypothetical protein